MPRQFSYRGDRLANQRIQERRLSCFHFAHDHEQERLTDVAQQSVQRFDAGLFAANLDAQFEQTTERSFELGSKLQIVIGDHAAIMRKEKAKLRAPVQATWETRRSQDAELGKASEGAVSPSRATRTRSR